MSREEPIFNWRVIGSNEAEYECTTMEEALRIAGKRGIIEPLEGGALTPNPVKTKNPMIQNLRGKGFARVVKLLDGLIEITLFSGMRKGPPIEVGSLMMIHRPSDIFEVLSSLADDGYGPLLYEIAMEYAVQQGAIGLAPDRNIVSYQAEEVWEKFLNRDDISVCHLEHCSEPQLSLHERDHLNWAMWKKKPNQINKLKKKGQWAEGSESLYSGSWNDRRVANPTRLRNEDYEVELEDGHKAKKAGERWERSRAARKNPRRKNAALSPHDAARLLQTLAQGAVDTVHGVKVRKVGAGHFVIRGTRYTTSEAASIVAREGCA